VEPANDSEIDSPDDSPIEIVEWSLSNQVSHAINNGIQVLPVASPAHTFLAVRVRIHEPALAINSQVNAGNERSFDCRLRPQDARIVGLDESHLVPKAVEWVGGDCPAESRLSIMIEHERNGEVLQNYQFLEAGGGPRSTGTLFDDSVDNVLDTVVYVYGPGSGPAFVDLRLYFHVHAAALESRESQLRYPGCRDLRLDRRWKVPSPGGDDRG
jgi:hypothetical protein